MDMSEHSLKDLGVLTAIVAEAGFYKMARSYLNEMALRLGAMEALNNESASAKISRELRRNDLLLELPTKTTEDQKLTHEKLESGMRGKQIEEKWAADGNELREPPQPEPVPEPETQPEPGMIRDENGKVTHVSVKHGELGYDPEIHENTALKIFCDGTNVENAHTANTVDGVVKYHKKNAQGRIKTLEVHGKVEIKGVE